MQATRMSCVPFARADSGIDLAGNAYAWWSHAAGTYARGDAPVPGSVLTFRANERMRLGHVAVVSRVVNRREIEVDQSNWGNGGRITRAVPVIDVSEDNDWTEVRVALGDGRFGSVYPTYGFIYDRPDTGTMLAARHTPAPELAANPAPSELRALHPDMPRLGGTEVAELPGPLPAPPHWPARLGHSLHTRFVHHDVRHAAYRHPAVSHWAPHHAPLHRVTLHGVGSAHREVAER
ncbi:MAG: CHAP domain-containing protein [Acetobacteraceae bacterium]